MCDSCRVEPEDDGGERRSAMMRTAVPGPIDLTMGVSETIVGGTLRPDFQSAALGVGHAESFLLDDFNWGCVSVHP
jgi:hypothetical protein